MKQYYRVIAIVLILSLGNAYGQDNILNGYIDTALQNNIIIQQKNISYQQATYGLQMAKGMYLPRVNLMGDYQTADGGRDIQLPLGDLLNEAYSSLNQLTQSNKFPQLKNESINFLPFNFYDVKLRTTVPIIQPALGYNKKIKEQQTVISALELDTYKRELVKDVKTAYYQYLQTNQSIAIYRSALELANEGKRVNEKLLENGKGLPAYVVRSKSEIADLEAKLIGAEQQAANAMRYFNFLLNREQEASIDSQYDMAEAARNYLSGLQDAVKVSGREELKSLTSAIDIRDNFRLLQRAAYFPTLNGFLDLGSQAQNWKFNDQSRYYMIGLQLNVPIFAGNQTKYSVKQAALDVSLAEKQLELTSKQLALSGTVARNNLTAAYRQLEASQQQLDAAATYNRLIERGYREGVQTYIESIDARNQYTQARLAVALQTCQVLMAAAAYERETASFDLHTKNQ